MAAGEPELPPTNDWLSSREAELLSRIRFTKRYVEFLTRRWTAKRAVAAVADHPNDPAGLSRIEVLNHPSGAPYALIDGAPAGVGISMTDRAGWAVCLVGDDDRLGIDLELVEPRTDGFVRDYLTAAEQAMVRASSNRDLVANLMWSAKEAVLKVLQTGLRADTRSVEVSPDLGPTTEVASGWHELLVTNHDGRRFPGWWRRDGQFVLTVTWEDEAGPPPAALPGSADLAAAEPRHSWLAQPLVERPG